MDPFPAATPGIYFRPEVKLSTDGVAYGTRPRRENEAMYTLAEPAGAEGGRACVHCRPDLWPHTISSSGPELVCRGVRLILDGALDGATEAELGARLGVSPRHLRRLFTAHLGVTPAGLARSARAHSARRLLDDTDLSMLQIALATGFGSVRQFNRTVQEVFHASPRALRAKRRKADRLVADGGLPLRLVFKGPLDWASMLGYFATHAIPGVENVSGAVYRRTIVVDGTPGVLELGPGGDDHLVLVAHLPHWWALVHLVARARRIANLDLDPEGPARHLDGDPAIGPLVRARPGLRVPGTWDPFETGVRAIVGERVPAAAANSAAGRLVERFGARVPGLSELGLTHTFPSAEELASANLGGIGVPSARARAIRGFARAVAEGRVHLDGSADLDELVSTLTSIDGVGPWTAQYLALRIGEPDALPAGDIDLRRALDPYGQSKPSALARVAERWRPWRAPAAMHLWTADEVQRAPSIRPPGAWLT